MTTACDVANEFIWTLKRFDFPLQFSFYKILDRLVMALGILNCKFIVHSIKYRIG